MDLRKFKDRLRTFGCLTRCNKQLLAREGWYFTGLARRVKCHACHAELDIGRFGKGIIESHLMKSPECKLTKRRQYLRDELTQARSRITLFMTKNRHEKYPLENPRVPAMADVHSRGRTFECEGIAGNHYEMVEAGLYWAHNKEQAVCYYCGGCFEIQQIQDNSKIQHARGRPQCDYINRYLGPEVVQMVQEYFCQEEIPEELITNIVEAKQDSAVVENVEAEENKPR